MTCRMFETEIDCLNEIASHIIVLIPESWSHAGVDVVRHNDTEYDFRGYFLKNGDQERYSFSVDDQLYGLFKELAPLTSTAGKGFYKEIKADAYS